MEDGQDHPAEPRAEPTVRFDVLGPVRVQAGGTEIDLPGAKPRLLVAALVAQAGREVSSERLIDSLWTDDPPPSARKAVQVYVSNLRRSLGESAAIKTSPGGYVLQTAEVGIDAIEFEHAVEQATSRIRTDPAGASAGLSAALSMWRGPAYGEMASSPALEGVAVGLEELRLLALERRIGVDLRLGRHAELVGELETLTQEHPYREQFRADHMLALYRSGRQADALRAFTRTRELLVEELGLEPSPELQRLHQQILEQSGDLAVDEDPAPTSERRGFLVSDIVSSMAHWQRDPEAMGRALARHDEILDGAIAEHGGRIFKHTGDGVLAVFPNASAAAGAGVAAQQRLGNESWSTAEPVTARMAVDDGPVEQRGDDFFGPVLNRVMRVMSAGHGGQLLVSSFAVTGIDQPIRTLGDADLRGIGRVEVYQIVTAGLDGEFPELRTDRTPPAIGRSAFGQAIRGYELREVLGTGASGVVYRAYQASVGREVAIKLIRPERANDPAFVKRFEAEAQFVAQLEHPHIVSLYDYWRDPDGAFLVMPLMKAGSVAQALERAQLNPSAALRLIEQVGTALAYAHRHGVLHRDIKPANVLLDDDGNAYLSDFGIASDHLVAHGDTAQSTVAYLAPEELAGRAVDERADIYCLGLLAHEALTGRRPELGGGPGSVHQLRADVPAAIDEVLDRATALDPAHRYDRAEDFVRAFRQALGADVVNPTATRSDEAIRNPFKGLRAFSEVDAGDFHGRDELVERLLASLDARALTVAVGPSGIGKSSVIRAGVVPAIRAGRLGGSWLVADMFPGSHPFEELEAALLRVAVDRPDGLMADLESDDRGLMRVVKQILPSDDSSLLLIIDQFEELFSLVTDDTVRRQFLDSLVALADDSRSRVRVVATMRADFFDRPLEYPAFGRLLHEGLVPVSMPGRDEIAAAISRPARDVGLDLEPGLVGAIVDDVVSQPGGLPLLQHAMTEIVERRTGNVVSLESYRASGGVTGALARRAEDIFDGLTPSGRVAAKEMFLRLVTVSDDAEDTRRRVRRSELVSMAAEVSAIDSVIEAYGSFRLLSFDHDVVTRGPTVEVAHEALLREWPRLRGWVDEHRNDLLHGRRLAEATHEWTVHDRDSSYLLRGVRLAEVRRWNEETSLRRTAVEQQFLDASADAADADEREAEENEARDRRLQRRSRLLIGTLAGVVVLALLAAAAIVNRNRAVDEQARAETERARAEGLAEDAVESAADADFERGRAEDLVSALAFADQAQRLAAQANAFLDEDSSLSVTLAVEAARATSELGYVTASAADSLQWALRAAGAGFPTDETTPVALRPSPDGVSGAFMVPIGELIEFAQDGFVRDLSDEECAQFFAGTAARGASADGVSSTATDSDRSCPDPTSPFPPVAHEGGDEKYLEFTDPEQPLAGTTVTVQGNTSDQQFAERTELIYNKVLEDQGIEAEYLKVTGLLASADVVDEADVFLSPQPGYLSALAASGRLVDITSSLVDDDPAERFGPVLWELMRLDLDSSRAGGQVYTVPVNLDNKSLVFYNRAIFDSRGYEFPDTIDELTALSQRMVDDGVTPWCWASNAGEQSGFTNTDWIETVLIRTAGLDAYRDWWRGDLPFSSPEVKEASETLGQFIFPAGFTANGAGSIPFGSYWGSWGALGGENPPCAMQLGAQYALTVSRVPVETEAGYGIAPFPTVEAGATAPVVGGGNFLAVTQDSPEARAMVRAAQTDRFYDLSSGVDRTFIAPDAAYESSDDTTPLQRTIIDATHQALRVDAYRFDGSDLMPPIVGGDVFFSAPDRWFTGGPGELDSVLRTIDEAWPGRSGDGFAYPASDGDPFSTPLQSGRYRIDQLEPPVALEIDDGDEFFSAGGRFFYPVSGVADEIFFGDDARLRAFSMTTVTGFKTLEEGADRDPSTGSIPIDDIDRFIDEHGLLVSNDRSTTVGGRTARVIDVRIDPDVVRSEGPCVGIQAPCFWMASHPERYQRDASINPTKFDANEIRRLWFVQQDVDRMLLISAFAGQSTVEWLDAAEDIVSTLEFLPTG